MIFIPRNALTVGNFGAVSRVCKHDGSDHYPVVGRRPTVAVDFDGRIADSLPEHDLSVTEPREGAREWLERFRQAGIYVIIWTGRDDQEGVEGWLDEHGIPYDEYNDNRLYETDSRKIVADIYLDDHGEGDPDADWDDLGRMVFSRIFGKVRQPIDEYDGYDELKELAEKGYEELEELLSNLDFRTVRIEGLELGEFEEQVRKPGGVVLIAPMKGYKRAKEKVEGDYGGNWSKLLDIVRAAVVVDTVAEVYEVVEALRSAGAVMARPPKDRFKEPLANGYRDLLANYRLASGIVCEVQFHCKSIIIARERAQIAYDVIRAIKASAEEEGRDDYTPAEAEAMRRARKANEHVFARAWEECNGGDGERKKSWRPKNALRVVVKSLSDDILRAVGSSPSNFVSLADLGRRTGAPPAQLHAAVMQLRRQGVLTVAGFEGRHGASADDIRYMMPDHPGAEPSIGYVMLRKGFCPTGEGGGVDNSCGTGEAGGRTSGQAEGAAVGPADGWRMVGEGTSARPGYYRDGRIVSLLNPGDSLPTPKKPAPKKPDKSGAEGKREAKDRLKKLPVTSEGFLADHPLKRNLDDMMDHWMQYDIGDSVPKDAPVIRVPIDKIDAEEVYMYPKKVGEYIDNPPKVYGSAFSGGGRYYLMDGNHRILSALLRGESTVPLRVSPASFGQLDKSDKAGAEPHVAYRQNGDGSWTVRVAVGDRVFVHTNQNRSVLEGIVRDRYSNPNTVWSTKRWVTIGGGSGGGIPGHEGEEHHGGVRVNIGEGGKITHGPSGLVGHDVDNLPDTTHRIPDKPKPPTAEQVLQSLSKLPQTDWKGRPSQTPTSLVSPSHFFGKPDPDKARSVLLTVDGLMDQSGVSEDDFGAAKGKPETVDIRGLRPTQYIVDIRRVSSMVGSPEFLASDDRKDWPLVARKDGELWLLNGHNRLASKLSIGQAQSQVNVIDLDKISVTPKKSAPLNRLVPLKDARETNAPRSYRRRPLGPSVEPKPSTPPTADAPDK